MDEKTEELREIFIDTTGADTVTESQEESPGSLTDEGDVDERLDELLDRMRGRYGFDAPIDDHETVVRRFFEGDSDAEIAAELGVDEAAVFRARLDLHLVREADRDAPFDLERLETMHAEEVSIDERADELGVDEGTVRRYGAVVEADLESTRANDRFRDGFRELLTDSDIEGPLASEAREDGLEEATEDMETDVAF